MPLYGYKCECGYSFEAIKPIDDRHNAVCPKCNKPASITVSAWSRVIMAGTFQVIDGNGRVLESKHSIPRDKLFWEVTT